MYFVTMCTFQHKSIFGHIRETEIILNEFGKTANQCWLDLPNHYSNITLDEYIIMPDHVHGSIQINDFYLGEGLKSAPTINHGLSEIIRGFKTFSARRINDLRKSLITLVWQRSFYDHIIRNNSDLEDIRSYIYYNTSHPSNHHLAS